MDCEYLKIMRQLIIDKFGPVEHAEIEIRKYNLFIGQQSIGKSTIAKLITILTDHINLAALLRGGHDAWMGLLDEFNLSLFAADQNYHIDFLMEEGSINSHITIDNTELKSSFAIGDEKVNDVDTITKELFKNKPIFHAEEFLKKLQIASNKSKSKEVLDLIRDSLYVPAERNIISLVSKLPALMMLSGSIIPKTLLRFIVEMTKAREFQHEWHIPLMSISYVFDNDEDYFEMDGLKKKYPLRVASSGIQSLLPLYIVIDYARHNAEYSSYVVEEPECNLFPDKQIELLQYLLKTVSGEDMTLTITTHSPYILSAMNNYLLAGNTVKEKTSVTEETIREKVGDIPILDTDECSVYSLGSEINNGVYCQSLIDPEIGMINANTLDGISLSLGDEFDKIDALNFKS